MRVWVNDFASSTGNFGDFSAGNNLFADINNAAVDICSTRENGLSTRNSAKDGNYDVLNFLWYKGAEILYVNSSGKKILISSFTSYFFRPDLTCALSGFVNPTQSACLKCASGYVMSENKCVAACASDHVLHTSTNSCQSKF